MELEELVQQLAVTRVEEELMLHPEWLPQQASLQKKKEEEIKHELTSAISRFSDSLRQALTLLSHHPGQFTTELHLLEKFPNQNWLDLLTGWHPFQPPFSPDFLTWIQQEGERYQKEEKYPEALSIFQFLALLQPHSFLPYLHAGYCLFKQGQLDEAQALFDTAQQVQPTEPKCYYFASLCSLSRDQKAQAESLCEQGLHQAHLLHHPDWIHQLSLLKELIHKPRGEL